MAKYLKLFETTSQYNTYINGTPDLPNVSLCEDNNGVHYTPAAPQPIGVEGVVQIFANPECTAYADGTESTIYVRLNSNFGSNDNRQWFGSETASLLVQTPTDENPQDKYKIDVWFDWHSDETTNPFTAGQVVRCDGDPYSTPPGVQTIFYNN